MSLLRDLLAAVRELPSFVEQRIVEWADGIALSAHAPRQDGLGGVWCLRCKRKWPCPEWVRLAGPDRTVPGREVP